MERVNKHSIFRTLSFALLALLILLLIIGGMTWKNEIRSLMSIKEIMPGNNTTDGYVYEMKIYGDYYLDQYLESGGRKTTKT